MINLTFGNSTGSGSSPFTAPLNSGNSGWTSGSPFTSTFLTFTTTSTSSVDVSG